MPSRQDIVDAARAWVGTPWLHQGRTALGIDCAGLIIRVGNDLGLINFDINNYQRRTHGYDFLQHFQANMKQKPLLEAAPGDVMLFRDRAFPCHSTIVAHRNSVVTIIHAHAQRKKVVEEVLHQGDWLSRRVACFEFYGMV